MAKQKDFDSFLTNIEPSKSTVEYISSVQRNLRTYLEEHADYKYILLDTFLTGSYAKHTAIRPVSADKKRDVDIVVVTNYTYSDNATVVLQELCDMLKEKTLYDSAVVQSHSVGLELEGISIDVVPVIKHETYDDVYYVGSSADGSWTITDPKGHKAWSTEINKANNSKYKPLVKILKWWRRVNCPSNVKYPKGITLEKIIADNIGDSSLATEDLLIGTMQNIVNKYMDVYVANEEMPYIEDPSEYILDNDLLSGYTFSDFKAFVEKINEQLKKLNEDGTSNSVWKEILGQEFPNDISTEMSLANVHDYLNVSHRQKAPWKLCRSGAVFITAKVTDWDGRVTNYESDSYPIEKHCSIAYTASYNSCKKHRIMWQIVNTGNDARCCLRGGFEHSNIGEKVRRETTMYTGKHYVQCFVLDRYGNCVACSKEFFINVK